MILKELLGTNKTAIMKRSDEFSFTPGLEWSEGMDHPVMGVHDLRALLQDNATQGPQRFWIGEGWQVSTLFICENRRHTLHRTVNTVDAHILPSFEFWQSFLPERCDRDIMSASSQRNAEIMYMLFYPADDGWIELCKH